VQRRSALQIVHRWSIVECPGIDSVCWISSLKSIMTDASSPKPPHILYITTDQLRPDALSCYGCEAIDTPNLDRLAAEGCLFRKAYCASPICLPSRYTMITGQFPHTNRLYSNLTQNRLSPDQPNLYKELKAIGYRTGHIGKCHYTGAPYKKVVKQATVDEEACKAYYMSLGIDNLYLQNDKNNSQWFYDDYSRECELAGHLEAWRNEIRYSGKQQVFTFPGPAEWHPDSWVGRKAVDYVQTQQGDRPQFLWVSFSGPHYPFDPPAEYLDRVRDDKVGQGHWHPDEFNDPRKIQSGKFHNLPVEERLTNGADGQAGTEVTDEYWFQVRRHYYANVAQIDEYIGKILHQVKEKWGDQVLIVFTADHGELLGDHKMWGKNRCFHEPVFRVPFILKSPTHDYPAETDARVQLPDIMPTMLTHAGHPERIAACDCDGRDLKELIEAGGREYVFCEQDKWMAVSNGRYKYAQCLSFDDERLFELYDLGNDPHELFDLGKKPEAQGIVQHFQGVIVDRFLKEVLGRGKLCGNP